MKTAIVILFFAGLFTSWNPHTDYSEGKSYQDVTIYSWTENQEKFFESWKSNKVCPVCRQTIYSFDSSLTHKGTNLTIHYQCKEEFLRTHKYLK